MKEAIITDVNDLVQEFLRTSRDHGAASVEESLFEMRRLHEFLERYSDEVSLYLSRFCDCRRFC